MTPKTFKILDAEVHITLADSKTALVLICFPGHLVWNDKICCEAGITEAGAFESLVVFLQAGADEFRYAQRHNLPYQRSGAMFSELVAQWASEHYTELEELQLQLEERKDDAGH